MYWFRSEPPNAKSVLDANRMALRDSFDQALAATERRAAARKWRDMEIGPYLFDDDERSPAAVQAAYNMTTRAVEQSSLAVQNHAADLFVICDRMLRDVARLNNRETSDIDAVGPKVGEAKFGGVVRSTVNNLRHYRDRDWGLAEPKRDDTRKNIRTLQDAGVEPPWNRLVADEMFAIMEFRDYSDFERRLEAALGSLDVRSPAD
jgi:hypothetical protein